MNHLSEPTGATPVIDWLDETTFRIDGIEFSADNFMSAADGRATLINKPPNLVRDYLELIERERPQRIVELGVKDGGSAMLMSLAAEPERLLALDLEAEVPTRLKDFIAGRGLEARVKAVGGVDQSDRSVLTSLLDDWFGEEPLDLVVDDASHMFAPSLRSFDVCFPRLRPGGVFVLEDWPADDQIAAAAQRALEDAGRHTSERVDQIRALVHAFNNPGEPLPDGLYEELSAAFANLSDEERNRGTGVAGLVNIIVQVGARVDLSEMPPAPPRLSDLSIMAVRIRAVSADTVADVRISGDWTAIRRGPAALDVETFSLEAMCSDHFGYVRSGARS